MKIGIPKALYYYFFSDKWDIFFKELNVEVITSCNTNKEILKKGCFYASDEMCLSLKIFLGHIDYLKDKCDYVLIPRIDNFGIKDQMCCNYICLYDLVNNLFDLNILTYTLDYRKRKKEIDGFIKIGKELGFKTKEIKNAYKKMKLEYNKIKKRKIYNNNLKLESENKKILLVSHPYNLYDSYVVSPIIDNLKKLNCEIIYSDCFDEEVTNNLSKYLSNNLYWKYSKESIGSIVLCNEKIDGIIFLTTFPCGLDSLVNELVMRKIGKPYLNLVIDDLDSSAGIETRIESFVDIIEQN